jgi:hypothetical protein
MKILLGLVIVLAIVYGLAGVVMAFYESSQTDDPFNWTTILTWLPKMFGMNI